MFLHLYIIILYFILSRLKDAVDSGGSPTSRLGAPLSPRGGPLSPRIMSGGLGAPWGAAATAPKQTRYSKQQLLDLYTGKEPVPASYEQHTAIMREETILPVGKRPVTEAEQVQIIAAPNHSIHALLNTLADVVVIIFFGFFFFLLMKISFLGYHPLPLFSLPISRVIKPKT